MPSASLPKLRSVGLFSAELLGRRLNLEARTFQRFAADFGKSCFKKAPLCPLWPACVQMAPRIAHSLGRSYSLPLQQCRVMAVV